MTHLRNQLPWLSGRGAQPDAAVCMCALQMMRAPHGPLFRGDTRPQNGSTGLLHLHIQSEDLLIKQSVHVSCLSPYCTRWSRGVNVQAVNPGLRCTYDQPVPLGDLPGRCVCCAHDCYRFVLFQEQQTMHCLPSCGMPRHEPRMRVQIRHRPDRQRAAFNDCANLFRLMA